MFALSRAPTENGPLQIFPDDQRTRRLACPGSPAGCRRRRRKLPVGVRRFQWDHTGSFQSFPNLIDDLDRALYRSGRRSTMFPWHTGGRNAFRISQAFVGIWQILARYKARFPNPTQNDSRATRDQPLLGYPLRGATASDAGKSSLGNCSVSPYRGSLRGAGRFIIYRTPRWARTKDA